MSLPCLSIIWGSSLHRSLLWRADLNGKNGRQFWVCRQICEQGSLNADGWMQQTNADIRFHVRILPNCLQWNMFQFLPLMHKRTLEERVLHLEAICVNSTAGVLVKSVSGSLSQPPVHSIRSGDTHSNLHGFVAQIENTLVRAPICWVGDVICTHIYREHWPYKQRDYKAPAVFRSDTQNIWSRQCSHVPNLDHMELKISKMTTRIFTRATGSAVHENCLQRSQNTAQRRSSFCFQPLVKAHGTAGNEWDLGSGIYTVVWLVYILQSQ